MTNQRRRKQGDMADEVTIDDTPDDALTRSGTPELTTRERLALYTQAKKELAALRVAEIHGEPIPATPNLEELHRRYEDKMAGKKNTTTNGTRRSGGARTDIRYFHDGKSMSETHKHKLSTLAYFHSKDIDGPEHLSTSEFVELLKKLGVDDPYEPGWMVTLPNGVTVECRKDGESPKAKPKSKDESDKPEPKARAATPKKSPAKKAAAKKAPAKKAAAAKKATSGKNVTPIPKKGATKRLAAKAS